MGPFVVPEDALLDPQEAQVGAGSVEGGKPHQELVHAATERPEIRLSALEHERAQG